MRLVFTDPEIHQLAIIRTAVTSNYSLTATAPLGQRFQFFHDGVGATEIGATVAQVAVRPQPPPDSTCLTRRRSMARTCGGRVTSNVLSAPYANTGSRP